MWNTSRVGLVKYCEVFKEKMYNRNKSADKWLAKKQDQVE